MLYFVNPKFVYTVFKSIIMTTSVDEQKDFFFLFESD